MELLDHTGLHGHRQWRLAHTLLSFIGHGYVWQEGEDDVPKVDYSPSQLTRCRYFMLMQVCAMLVHVTDSL